MPYAPDNLEITGVTNTTITFTWEALGTLDGFQFTVENEEQGFTRTVDIDNRYRINTVM